MNYWHSPKDKLPEQGKKILCMDGGDFYVAQRFSIYWLQIPFTDSALAYTTPPEMWQEIEFPCGLRGKTYLSVDGAEYDVDELEQNFPDVYAEFIEMMRKGSEEKND